MRRTSRSETDVGFEADSLVQGERIGFCNDRDDVDDVCKFTKDGEVERTKAMAGRVEEVQGGVDAGIDDVAVAQGSQLFTEIRRMLVLDILDDRVCTAIVVDQVSEPRGIDDIQRQSDAIFV